jgi:hypothetical protein
MFVRHHVAAVLLIAGLSACSEEDGLASDRYRGGGAFGDSFETMDASTDTQDSDAGTPEDDGSAENVRLRVLQGVLNLRAAYLCHAPDFELDSPDASLEGALELPIALGEAGTELGEPTAYESVPSMTSGAITVHRAPAADAGHLDPAIADAGTADAGASAPPRCDRASLEAVLPLPMPVAWIDPPRAALDAGAAVDGGGGPDAGRSLETRGFAGTVSGNAPLTLFGSGLLLERGELERRVEEEKKRFERAHPDDPQGALAAAEHHRRLLEATYGPRFLLSRAEPALRKLSFSLQFSHLIPDVPGPSDGSSGALHLCVTVGSTEGSELGDAGAAGFAFRNHVALGNDLDPSPSYRFRVFVQSAYADEQRTCATTSLKPVAELMVEPGYFDADSSYTLVAVGAQAPEAICTRTSDPLIRAGCAQAVDSLRATLKLVKN